MDFFKIIMRSLLLVCIFLSCEEKSSIEMVSKVEYDAKINEYLELNKQQNAIIDDNIKKSKVIANVVSELRQLTGYTANLRANVEVGQAEITHADEIKLRLEKLKSILANVPQNKDDKNENLLLTINNLRIIIEEKEQEIIYLKEQIEERNAKIQEQSRTIGIQQVQLTEKERESWYKLGNELYQVAKELPKVKGRKDKRNIKNSKYYIYNKAKECMDRAAALGHSDALRMSKLILEEMEKL